MEVSALISILALLPEALLGEGLSCEFAKDRHAWWTYRNALLMVGKSCLDSTSDFLTRQFILV